MLSSRRREEEYLYSHHYAEAASVSGQLYQSFFGPQISALARKKLSVRGTRDTNDQKQLPVETLL